MYFYYRSIVASPVSNQIPLNEKLEFHMYDALGINTAKHVFPLSACRFFGLLTAIITIADALTGGEIRKPAGVELSDLYPNAFFSYIS